MCSASQDRSTAEPEFEPRSSVPEFWVPALDLGYVGEAMGPECGIWGPRALVSDSLYSLPVHLKQAFPFFPFSRSGSIPGQAGLGWDRSREEAEPQR